MTKKKGEIRIQHCGVTESYSVQFELFIPTVAEVEEYFEINV